MVGILAKRTSQNFEKGESKQFVLLFLSISLITFSNCLFLFIEKLLLGYLSVQAMEAAVNASYICQIFQVSSIALASMAQVFVGNFCGANQQEKIGSIIWQFIWFSLLSLFITIPCGLIYGHFYFKETEIADIVFPYFSLLISMNFLYPLAASLSSFYLGQGKTSLVLWATLCSQAVKVLLAYFLILGWNDWIPAMGLMGGAISTTLTQGGLCILLFLVFINQKHKALFHSHKWKIHFSLFWECMQPGFLRALARILTLASWASIAHLMTSKGGNYLFILSIGGTLFLFLPFLAEALCQAQITVISHLLGAGCIHRLNQVANTGYLFSLGIIAMAAIPLLLFPEASYALLFPKIFLEKATITQVFLGIWLSFIFFNLSYVPLSFILVFKDTAFLLFMGAVNWIYGFIVMYGTIYFFEISAENFWLALSPMHALSACCYFLRMRFLRRKIEPSKKVLLGIT